jgi:hypothetical protein
MSALVDVPTVTLSTLARAMGPIAPASLARLLRGHKYRSSGPRRSYQCARRQAIARFTDGESFDPTAPLRSHEREAVLAMQRMRLRAPEWTRAIEPRSKLPAWELGGVRVSMQPDVELDGLRETGAAKFCFTKAPLARGIGSVMAALLFHHRRHLLGIVTTEPRRCVVYEPRLQRIHLPGRSPERQVKDAELACRVIGALWPTL